MPIVLGVVFLVMYLWFFRYDRCLMELDMAGVTLRAACVSETDPEGHVAVAASEWKKRYFEKYYAWEDSILAGWERGHVILKGDGSLAFPLPGLNFWSADDRMRAAASCEVSPHREAYVLRCYRRLRGFVT